MPSRPLNVSLVAIPDGVVSTLTGIYDVLSSLPILAEIDGTLPRQPVFHVEIVGESDTPVAMASGLPIAVHRSVDQIGATDIVIVPSLLVSGERWQTGRYPVLVDWLADAHQRGALLCSACSGIFLLAETGLYVGVESTVHWAYSAKFRKTFPDVPIQPEKVLVASGERQQFLSSGASTSWHDLVLHLVSRHAGAAAALAAAKFFAMEWHRDGLAPFAVFMPPREHGDATVLACQDWLASHFSVANPVEEMVVRSGLAPRTFKRRFAKATDMTPITYVQNLRIEETKRMLESTDSAIDEISWQVGYEDPSFFRRLFKRHVGITPGIYRRKFKLPESGED